MPIYVKLRGEKCAPRAATFYVDDSACEFGGVRHILLGAITFEDEARAVANVLQFKKVLGLSPSDEIKWNSKVFTAKQRHFITENVLPVLSSSTGCLVVVEGAKQQAALFLAEQLANYCADRKVAGFVCRFDKGIISDGPGFDNYAYGLSPPCGGWCEIDSAHDQLIQCADLFVGFQKLRLDFGLGRADPKKLVEVEAYEGEREKYELEWYLRLALRWSLWGVMEGMPGTDNRWKNNMVYGVRIHSTVPQEVKEKALSHIGREYMGCIHWKTVNS